MPPSAKIWMLSVPTTLLTDGTITGPIRRFWNIQWASPTSSPLSILAKTQKNVSPLASTQNTGMAFFTCSMAFPLPLTLLLFNFLCLLLAFSRTRLWKEARTKKEAVMRFKKAVTMILTTALSLSMLTGCGGKEPQDGGTYGMVHILPSWLHSISASLV